MAMLGGYDLDRLLDAIRLQESGSLGQMAVSPKGARTAYGIMPTTAADPGYGLQGTDINSLVADEAKAREFSKNYLLAMYNKTGDVNAALAAYNGGLGRGLSYKKGGAVPTETANYVPGVLNKYANAGDNRPVSSGGILNALNPISSAHAANYNPVTGRSDVGMAGPMELAGKPLESSHAKLPWAEGQYRGAVDGKNLNPMVAAMQPPQVQPPQNIVPPPMQAAMAGDNSAPVPQKETPFYKDKNYWKRALIGAGAGLSSITNPAGAAVAADLLKQLDDNDSRYSTQQLYDGTVLKIERSTGDVTVVRQGSEALKYKKEGLPDPASAEATFHSVSKNLDDMNKNMDVLINADDKDLGYLTGTGVSLLPNGPAELSLSGGVASKLGATYDTLQAAGTLDEVRQLKEQSATLGQISNYEDQLFQKAFAPVNKTMAPADFRAAMIAKKQAIEEIKMIMKQKYEGIYGRSPGATPHATPSANPSNNGFKFLGAE